MPIHLPPRLEGVTAAATTTAITITALLPAWLLRLFPRSILQSIATLARRNVIGAIFDLSVTPSSRGGR